MKKRWIDHLLEIMLINEKLKEELKKLEAEVSTKENENEKLLDDYEEWENRLLEADTIINNHKSDAEEIAELRDQ